MASAKGPQPTLLGPLFWYEVARQTRRGHGTLMRCLFVLILLGVAYFFYAQHFAVDLRRISFEPSGTVSHEYSSRFALRLFFLAMLWQAVAVLLITPSYVATAIAEEKQRGTMELLFTTFVTSREIVVGKLFSRLLHLAAFLLAGVPVLCLNLLWGGLALRDILIGYAVLLITLFSVGSLSIYCSVRARSVLGAELNSYGLTILVTLALMVVFVLIPFQTGGVRRAMLGGDQLGMRWHATSAVAFFLEWEDWQRRAIVEPGAWRREYTWLITYALVHGVIGLVALMQAISGFRTRCLAQADRSRRQPGQSVARPRHRLRHRARLPTSVPDTVPSAQLADEPMTEAPSSAWGPLLVPEPPVVETATYVRRYELAPLGEDPLFWKEVHHGSNIAHPDTLRQTRRLLLVGVLLGTALMLLLQGAAWWEAKAAQAQANANRAPRPESLFVGGPKAAVPVAITLRDMGNLLLRLTALIAMVAWCAAVGLRAANTLSLERTGQTLLGLLTLPWPRRRLLRAKWFGSILRYQWLGWVLLAAVAVGLFSGLVHPLLLAILVVGLVCHLAFVASFGLWLSLVMRNPLSVQLCMSLVIIIMCTAPLLLALYLPDQAALSEQSTLWHQFKEIGASPANTWWFLLSTWPEPSSRFWLTVAAIGIGLVLYAVVAVVLWKGACALFDKVQGDEVGGK